MITDAMVETATRANYDAMTWPGAWAELDSDLQESGGERAAMREALEAVAPLIAAKAWEEGYTEGSRGRMWGGINPYQTRADAIERAES